MRIFFPSFDIDRANTVTLVNCPTIYPLFYISTLQHKFRWTGYEVSKRTLQKERFQLLMERSALTSMKSKWRETDQYKRFSFMCFHSWKINMTTDRATSVFNFTLVPSNIAKHLAIVWWFFHLLYVAILWQKFFISPHTHWPCLSLFSSMTESILVWLTEQFHPHSLTCAIALALHWYEAKIPFEWTRVDRCICFASNSIKFRRLFLWWGALKDLMKHDDANRHIIDGVSFTRNIFVKKKLC